MLQGWVLLRARVQQAEGLPFEVEDGEAQQGREFYLLRWASGGGRGGAGGGGWGGGGGSGMCGADCVP